MICHRYTSSIYVITYVIIICHRDTSSDMSLYTSLDMSYKFIYNVINTCMILMYIYICHQYEFNVHMSLPIVYICHRYVLKYEKN